MIKKNKLAFWGFLFLFVLFCIPTFAENSLEFNEDIYEIIDLAFLEKDPETVSRILSSYRSSPEYVDYEEYVLQKTRGLLLSNQLDLIQAMAMAILDNKLDNIDAINLYMTVEKSVAKRNARQKALEEQRKAEAEYVAKATEKEKESIRKDYQTIENTASGQTVFVAPVSSKYYSTITWSASLNIAELGLYFGKDLKSINYGVGFSGDICYRGAQFSVGADLFLDTSMLDFSNSGISMSEISFVPALSFVTLHEDFFFRLGFTSMKLKKEDSFLSPVVGLGMKNINLNDNMRFGFFLDYLPGHFINKNMNFALSAGLQNTIILGNLGNLNIGLFLNFRESFFLLKDGFDSRTRITIGFGVENND